MGMTQAGPASRSAEFSWLRLSPRTLTVFGFGLLVCTVGLLWLPSSIVSGDAVYIAAVLTAFFLLLAVGLGIGIARHVGRRVLVLRMTALIWWFVLICEVVFDHTGDAYHTYSGQFSPQVYGEGLVWVVGFVMVVIFALSSPGFLRQLFEDDYKWATLLVLVCLMSIVLSPSKTYALGWGFKLLLCLLLLRLAGSMIQTQDDILTFMKANIWAFCVLTIIPVFIAFSDPSTAFDGVGGRLNADPDALSGTASYFMLLCLLMNAVEKKRIYVVLAVISVIINFLALGKAGIIAGIFGALVFFLLQKKIGRSLGLLLGMGGLGLIILMSTPLGEHLRTYEGASTFTGRTVLWQAALQAIRQKPIVGHGYLSSYFAWVRNDLAINGPTAHLESSFMELTYNNGLIGLGLMIALQWGIIRNILSVIRIASERAKRSMNDFRAKQMHLLAVGMLAIYITLFLAGLVNSSIGGRAMPPYMLFLSIFMLSIELRRLSVASEKSALTH